MVSNFVLSIKEDNMETATMTKTKWTLDPAHSEIGFKVKHMMITNVSGSFEKFDAQVETTGVDFSTAKIEFTADVNSITTSNADRDAHLKSADFFDAANHPELKFVSTKVEKLDDERYIVDGNLSVRDVTKPIKMDVEFGGVGKDPWGNEKAGFTITGKINRSEYKLNWNAALEAGGVLVGEEVKIQAEIQLIRQA
jgi:polyisoprenoid-binding protein YceI